MNKYLKYTDFKQDLYHKLDNGTITKDEFERKIREYCAKNNV